MPSPAQFDTHQRSDSANAAGAAAYVQVALDVPIAPCFDYRFDPLATGPLQAGDWVLVPWGRARRVGIVLAQSTSSDWPAQRVREVIARMDGAPRFDAQWLALMQFTARYYHRHPGEVMLPALPKLLRDSPAKKTRTRTTVFERARQRFNALAKPPDAAPRPDLNEAQSSALDALQRAAGFAVHLLYGVTGSGKTEVYLRWIEHCLQTRPNAQVLMLVPEIALTPQLAERVRSRFADVAVAILHSGLPEGERAAYWLAAADGRARILIGTRLAVLAPVPGLCAIVVDEEHDPSFKQQEGVRYSARDLAVMRARMADVPIVLGSATPSAETWQAARAGRYQLLRLPTRATGAALPSIRIVALEARPPEHGLGGEALRAVSRVLSQGGQAMVFLNRRGFAPVLSCGQCAWLSECPDCAAHRVLHRIDSRYRLICHHCGGDSPVPRACPACGDQDLQALGRGTQRLEQALRTQFPDARVARLDRDVARHRGAAQAVLAGVHGGDIDLVVGTQMLAKGHDFKRLGLVIVADPDAALFSSDFRAPERLFATLMQVAGRAGRAEVPGEVIVQTRYPGQPLYEALVNDDFDGFADRLLDERRDAALPPFRYQALLRAEASELGQAIEFLSAARLRWEEIAVVDADAPASQVQCFDPVPMPVARLAGRARAQLLLESGSRSALHRRLSQWLPGFEPSDGRVRWQIEVDPAEI